MNVLVNVVDVDLYDECSRFLRYIIPFKYGGDTSTIPPTTYYNYCSLKIMCIFPRKNKTGAKFQ